MAAQSGANARVWLMSLDGFPAVPPGASTMPLLVLALSLIAAAPPGPQGSPAASRESNVATTVESLLAPPSPRDARALGVGRHVADAAAADLDGARRS